MVKVQLTRNEQNDIVAYRVEGHANSGAYGKDIVCASISVLAQTMILGIDRILEKEPDWSMDHGSLICRVPDQISHDQRQQINTLLETMLLGLENIRTQYPESICIEIKEVH